MNKLTNKQVKAQYNTNIIQQSGNLYQTPHHHLTFF